jgi:hypothetical protein
MLGDELRSKDLGAVFIVKAKNFFSIYLVFAKIHLQVNFGSLSNLS